MYSLWKEMLPNFQIPPIFTSGQFSNFRYPGKRNKGRETVFEIYIKDKESEW